MLDNIFFSYFFTYNTDFFNKSLFKTFNFLFERTQLLGKTSRKNLN